MKHFTAIMAITAGSFASVSLYNLYKIVADDYFEKPMNRRIMKVGGLVMAGYVCAKIADSVLGIDAKSS